MGHLPGLRRPEIYPGAAVRLACKEVFPGLVGLLAWPGDLGI